MPLSVMLNHRTCRRRFAFALLGSLPFGPTRLGASQIEQVPIPLSSGGKPSISGYQNGILPLLEADLCTMSLVDTSGRVLFSGQLSLPGAIVTVILGVAVSPNQQVVIAGGAKSKDGTVAPVLVWADVRGNVKTVVQTASFFPGSVAFVGE